MEEITIKINIDDYLSEEEKKELVIQTFKETVKRELLDGHSDNTIQSDSEIQRVIGNITHHIVMKEVQKYIPDFEEHIKSKVRKVLTEKDLSYEIFKVKNEWDNEESKAITYMNEVINNSKAEFQKKIKDAILAYDPSDDIRDKLSDTFGEMGDTIYKLSELFGNR